MNQNPFTQSLKPSSQTKANTTVIKDENVLRPKQLTHFYGQQSVKEKVEILIQAAKKRNESVHHLLFSGPPGLGKTTLANIIASEMNCDIRVTSGPVLEKAADLAGLLSSIPEGGILFIDEIHRLKKKYRRVPISRHGRFRLRFDDRYRSQCTKLTD